MLPAGGCLAPLDSSHTSLIHHMHHLGVLLVAALVACLSPLTQHAIWWPSPFMHCASGRRVALGWRTVCFMLLATVPATWGQLGDGATIPGSAALDVTAAGAAVQNQVRAEGADQGDPRLTATLPQPPVAPPVCSGPEITVDIIEVPGVDDFSIGNLTIEAFIIYDDGGPNPRWPPFLVDPRTIRRADGQNFSLLSISAYWEEAPAPNNRDFVQLATDNGRVVTCYPQARPERFTNVSAIPACMPHELGVAFNSIASVSIDWTGRVAPVAPSPVLDPDSTLIRSPLDTPVRKRQLCVFQLVYCQQAGNNDYALGSVQLRSLPFCFQQWKGWRVVCKRCQHRHHMLTPLKALASKAYFFGARGLAHFDGKGSLQN